MESFIYQPQTLNTVQPSRTSTGKNLSSSVPPKTVPSPQSPQEQVMTLELLMRVC